MDTVAYSNDTETMRMPCTRHIAKVAKTSKATKTPESELMSVGEYFDMVWNRYLEKYEELHG